jgi:hypothetical protein
VRFRPTSGHFPDDGGAVTAEARFRVGGFRLHAYAPGRASWWNCAGWSTI